MKHILFVFSWLVVGGEETEVRLLAQHLDRKRHKLDVIACFHKDNMPAQTFHQLQALGIDVDTTPYTLSLEDTVVYLMGKMRGYDIVVACQAVPDVYPALERMSRPPLLIEHGGIVPEVFVTPKHLTARYVGVCASICEAAVSVMPDRPHHVLKIPSMVDLSEFSPRHRAEARAEWGISDETVMIGWVGRLDRKKRVQDFIAAAALVVVQVPQARFVIIGGADAFMPDYADELRRMSDDLGLSSVLRFLGDRPDVPRLLAGLDIFAWLSRGEGMPHVIAEAGAARLPVIATRDNGALEQITDEQTGLFVPHEDPQAVAAAMMRLIADRPLRRRLGEGLRAKVEREYSASVIIERWKQLFDDVMENARGSEAAD